MPHAVIIGAGTAGLTVARQLSQVPGFRVTILEATSRIGGRVRSIELNGHQVDMGASWLHETRVNPLFEIALEEKWPLKYTDKVTKFYTDKTEIPATAGVPQIIKDIESYVAEYFHQEKPILEKEPSLHDFVHSYVFNNMPLITDTEKKWAELMYRQVEHFIGQKWTEIPAGEGGEQSPLGRDAFLDTPGYQLVIDMLKSQINWSNVDLKLNEPVASINSSDLQTFKVATNLTSYDADFVVCSIPLGALKNSNGSQLLNGFSNHPELANITGAIERTSIAALGKIAVLFPSVNWDASVDSFVVACEETGDLVTIINASNGRDPVLIALTGPDLTQVIEQAGNLEAYKAIEWAFARISNSPLERPVAVAKTDWTQNIYYGCSYSARSIGQTYDDLVDAFVAGLGNFRFAGEHTTLEGNGCVHGAYLSGLREAQQIIELHVAQANTK